MQIVGRVESLWRYPVKSMRGERLREAFVGFAGIYGDRVYAFRSTAAPAGFPFLTGREKEQMLLYQPVFRRVDCMERPPNLAAAEALGSGVTPVYPAAGDTTVDVNTPDGETYCIDDPRLIARLSDGLGDRHSLSLMRSDRAMTDCRPVSVFGTWTARQLGHEIGTAIDQRRFRANIYIDFNSQKGFAEDAFVGSKLKIGRKTTITILQRDTRCKMITLDPDSAGQNPDVMRCVAGNHNGMAGVYGAVLIEGAIRPDDEVTLLD